MSWVDLKSFDADMRQFKVHDTRGLALIIGKSSKLNLDEAIKFGFIEPSKEIASALTKSIGVPDGSKIMTANKITFKLSELIKFAPNFNRTQIIQGLPEIISLEISQPSADGESQASKEVKEKIVDAGIKIGRARKDLYAKISRADIDGMTDAEKEKHITKTKLWPYSPSEARENGVEYDVAKFIHDMRFSMPDFVAIKEAQPSWFKNKEDSNSARDFVDFCEILSAKINVNVKTRRELFSAMVDIQKNQICKDYFRSIIYGSYVTRDFNKMRKFARFVEHNPQIRLRKDTIEIEDMTQAMIDDCAVENLHIPGFYECDSIHDRDVDDEETTRYRAELRDIYWGKLCKERKKNKTEDDDKPQLPDRPHLANLRNSWLPDEDISTQDLMDRFGFRGIEFGEWLPQDERQIVLNQCYSSCSALAEVTGLPDKMISINGALAIAFGSRGKGRAQAHYEPDLLVFNFTRMNGAGSVAHEWGHALDFYLSGKSSSLIESVDSRGLIDDAAWQAAMKLADEMNMTELNRARNAMIMVRGAIEQSTNPDLVMSELQTEISRQLDYAASWIVDWHAKVPSGEHPVVELTRLLRDEMMVLMGIDIDHNELPKMDGRNHVSFGFSEAQRASMKLLDPIEFSSKDLIEKLRMTTALISDQSIGKKKNCKNFALLIDRAQMNMHQYKNYLKNPERMLKRFVQSNFVIEATKLDARKSKKYFNTGKELFARSFESFVWDELSAREMPCDYLVHSVNETLFNDKKKYAGNPYPVGDERKQINTAMKRLCEVVKNSEEAKLKESTSKPKVT